MTNYADSQFYLNEYKGSLDTTLFSSLLPKASLIVKNNINRTLKEEEITDEIKWVTCALIELLHEEETKGNVSSISVDGVSKTYINNDFKVKRQEILNYLPQELTRYL